MCSVSVVSYSPGFWFKVYGVYTTALYEIVITLSAAMLNSWPPPLTLAKQVALRGAVYCTVCSLEIKVVVSYGIRYSARRPRRVVRDLGRALLYLSIYGHPP